MLNLILIIAVGSPLGLLFLGDALQTQTPYRVN